MDITHAGQFVQEYLERETHIGNYQTHQCGSATLIATPNMFNCVHPTLTVIRRLTKTMHLHQQALPIIKNASPVNYLTRIDIHIEIPKVLTKAQPTQKRLNMKVYTFIN